MAARNRRDNVRITGAKQMQNLILALLLTLSFQSVAQTEYSKLVNYVQKKYADNFTKYPILIFDQDLLEFRFAKADAFGEEKEKEQKRVDIIIDYVKEELGIELSRRIALSLEPYTSVLKHGAYAVPMLSNETGTYEERMVLCGVFAASPNSNQQLETLRLTGHDVPGAHDGVDYHGLQKKMSLKELQLFSMYHELAHCMDPKFMPANYGLWGPDAHGIHLSESFAETMALLLMQREGYSDLGLSRSYMRSFYARKAGPWFAQNENIGFGNPVFGSGGAIYYLTPVLLAAQDLLDRNKIDVNVQVDELMEETIAIVNENALVSRSFSAVVYSFKYGVEEALERYRDYALNTPDFFKETYSDLVTFLDFSNFMVESYVGVASEELPLVVALNDFDLDPLCEAFTSGDEQELAQLVQAERIALEQSHVELSLLKERQSSLDNVYQSLTSCQ